MMSARLALVALPLLPFSLPAADTVTPAARPATATDLTALRARAEGGDINAQYQLGLAYAQGLQTPKDPVEAYAWLTVAAENGAGGPALHTLLETLPQAQVANGRRRLEALRATNPLLRAAGGAPLLPAPSPSPVIAAPSRQPAPGSPLIPAPTTPAISPAEIKNLQDQLAAAQQDKRQLSTELSAAWKEIEQLKARPEARPESGVPSAAAQLEQANAALAKQAGDLAAARADAARLQEQLETTRASLAALTATAASAGDAATALQRERTAHAAAQASLAQLKTQLNEAAAGRAMLERDLLARLSAADRAQSATTEETRRANTQLHETSARVETLGRELAQARQDLTAVRGDLESARGRASADGDRQSRRVTELETALGTVRGELAQARTALAGATASAESATARAAASGRAETELAAARDRIAGLERELQTTQEASRRSELGKASADTTLQTAQQRLAAANDELAALRRQVTAARELEQRVRQLEAEKAAAPAPGVAISEEELARVSAAKAAAEDKLATALRSYTLLAQERDELRTRVADLSSRQASLVSALAAAEAQARDTTAANSAVTLASAELETLRNRAATAERAAESARAEAERAHQLLAGTRPAASAPTRPTTVTPGQPARTHTIASGETLSGISLRYYGTAARWPEILAANRDVLPDERSFIAGRTIRIP